LYLKNGGKESRQCLSRIAKRRRGIWQRRFWEHQIRYETDLQNHVGYIHYNPLKHELVKKVEGWPYHRYINEHKYTKDRWNQVRKEIEKTNVYE
jgi:putative transposase